MGWIDANVDCDATGGAGYGYTDEEWMLKQTLREYCETEWKPRWQELYKPETQYAAYHEFLAKLGEMDVLRLFVPKELGGLDMRMTTMMVAIEEVARVCGGVSIHVMEQQQYAKSMSRIAPAAFEKWGAGVLDGTILLAGSSCSPEGQANYSEIAPIGKYDEAAGEWVLNGAKAYSSGGAICDLVRIMGFDDEKTMYHWYMDPNDTPGLKRGAFEELGCSPSASWSMDNVRVPKEMGGICPVFVKGEMAPEGFDAFSMAVSAMSLGCMAAALDETIEYLKVRTKNFKPIATIPSIQYKLAELKARVEACRSFVIKATDLIEHNHTDAVLYSRIVKGYVCDQARYVCEECIQMWGAVGYDNNTGISRHLWDSIGFGIGCSTTDLQYRQAAYDMDLPEAERVLP